MKYFAVVTVAALLSVSCDDRQRRGAPEAETSTRPAAPGAIQTSSENTSQPNQGALRDQGDRGSSLPESTKDNTRP